jgi:hypothetical protein
MENAADNRWPRTGVLLAGSALLAAGYAAMLLRGPTPASEVSIVLAPAPAVEVLAEP